MLNHWHCTTAPRFSLRVRESDSVTACSPELGTTEGYPFKIDFNLLSSCCVGMLCFMCVLKCMYSYKNNFLRNNTYSVIGGFMSLFVYKWPTNL